MAMSTNVDFYENTKRLQEFQHASEQKRKELSHQLKMYHKSDERLQKLEAAKLQVYWKKICEDEKKSRARNERLLRELDRVESSMGALRAKTERLRLKKRQYEDYIERLYPRWRQRVMEKLEEAKNRQEQEGSFTGPSIPSQYQPIPGHLLPQSYGTPSQSWYPTPDQSRLSQGFIPPAPPPQHSMSQPQWNSGPPQSRITSFEPHQQLMQSSPSHFPTRNELTPHQNAPGTLMASQIGLRPGMETAPHPLITAAGDRNTSADSMNDSLSLAAPYPNHLRLPGYSSNQPFNQTDGLAITSQPNLRSAPHHTPVLDSTSQPLLQVNQQLSVTTPRIHHGNNEVPRRTDYLQSQSTQQNPPTAAVGTSVSDMARVSPQTNQPLATSGPMTPRTGKTSEVSPRWKSVAQDATGRDLSASVLSPRQYARRAADELRHESGVPSGQAGDPMVKSLPTQQRQSLVKEDGIKDMTKEAERREEIPMTSPRRAESKQHEHQDQDKDSNLSLTVSEVSSPSVSPQSPVVREETDVKQSSLSPVASHREELASVGGESPRNATSPDVVVSESGLIALLEAVQDSLKYISSHSRFYRTDIPTSTTRLEILRNANTGGNVDQTEPSLVSMVILDQLPLVVKDLEDGCLLPDKTLKLAKSFKTEDELRTKIPSSAMNLWNNLYSHWRVLVNHKVMTPANIADIFAPLLVKPGSQDIINAISLITNILSTPGDDQESSSESVPTPPLSPAASEKQTGVPHLKLESTAQRDDSDEDVFNAESPGGGIDLSQTAAYRNLLGGSGTQSKPQTYSDSGSDSLDDIEKKVTSVLSPRTQSRQNSHRSHSSGRLSARSGALSPDMSSDISAASSPGYVPSGLNRGGSTKGGTSPLSPLATGMGTRSGTAKKPAALRTGSDIETDSDLDLAISTGAGKQSEEEDDFDFYG